MCPNALPALLRDEKLQPGSSRSPQEGQLPPADLHQTASGACCRRDVVGLVSSHILPLVAGPVYKYRWQTAAVTSGENEVG